jgi:hypothetical protein
MRGTAWPAVRRHLVQASGALGDVLGVVADALEVAGDLQGAMTSRRSRPSAGAAPAARSPARRVLAPGVDGLVAGDHLPGQIGVAATRASIARRAALGEPPMRRPWRCPAVQFLVEGLDDVFAGMLCLSFALPVSRSGR